MAGEVDTVEGGTAPSEPPPPSRYTDAAGQRFVPVPLFGTHDDQTRLAAVLLLQLDRSEHAASERELQTRIASHLLAHGDVIGAPVPDVRTQSEHE